MTSATIKFCSVVINLIMFIEQKSKALLYLINSKLEKKKIEETLMFTSQSHLERCLFLLHLNQ